MTSQQHTTTFLLATALACGACGRTALGEAGQDNQEQTVGEGALAEDPDGGDRITDLLALLPARVGELVGYWHLNGDWSDASSRARPLTTESGSPGFVFDDAWQLDVSDFHDDSLRVSGDSPFEVPYLSFSLWFVSDLRYSDTSNSGHTLFKVSCTTCGGNVDIDTAIGVAARNDGSVIMGVHDDRGPDIDYVSSTGATSANAWHHLAGVYAADRALVFLDGVQVAGAAASHRPLPTTGGALVIGRRWPNTAPLWNPQYLHGRMRELAIWTGALDEAEIAAIYEGQRPR